MSGVLYVGGQVALTLLVSISLAFAGLAAGILVLFAIPVVRWVYRSIRRLMCRLSLAMDRLGGLACRWERWWDSR
jgi:hypothetical protein